MKKSQLRSIIRECIEEIVNEASEYDHTRNFGGGDRYYGRYNLRAMINGKLHQSHELDPKNPVHKAHIDAYNSGHYDADYGEKDYGD